MTEVAPHGTVGGYWTLASVVVVRSVGLQLMPDKEYFNK